MPLSTGKHGLMNEARVGSGNLLWSFCVGISRSYPAIFKGGSEGLQTEWLGFFLELRIKVTGLL